MTHQDTLLERLVTVQTYCIFVHGFSRVVSLDQEVLSRSNKAGKIRILAKPQRNKKQLRKSCAFAMLQAFDCLYAIRGSIKKTWSDSGNSGDVRGCVIQFQKRLYGLDPSRDVGMI